MVFVYLTVLSIPTSDEGKGKEDDDDQIKSKGLLCTAGIGTHVDGGEC